MRYFINLGYDGSQYSGWQRQKNTQDTIQEIIEDKLSQIFKTPTTVYGCGRTDAGVHASQYVMQVNLEQAPDFDFKFRLNKNLPDDIAVFEIFKVEDDQNCRYNAVARTYDYFIHWKKDPVLMRYSSFYQDLSLDYDIMEAATQLILKTRDFRAICKQPDLYDNTTCKITNCELFINEEQGRLRFTITSNRFLRGMIRILIFFLLKLGTGKLSLQEFKDILNQKVEFKDKQPALPNGLFLSKVEYPFLNLSDSHQLIEMLKQGLD